MAFTTDSAEPAAEERVVLCSADGDATGTAPKSTVHHRDTPLHLAFSCYVFDRLGRTLMTRRAQVKAVFPGVRTNSCCGHPAPGESMAAAVQRRLQQELGVAVPGVDLILPRFRYRATAGDGTVENELCPVYRAITIDDEVQPDVTEVDASWWVPWPEFRAAAADAASGGSEDPLSPWATQQVRQLAPLGPDPLRWPCAAHELLPPAASP